MKPKIVLIVAASKKDRLIGNINNEIPWPRLSEDMKYFRSVTLGFPIIMGRVTFETFKKNKETQKPEPLPGRQNIIITRNTDYEAPENVLIANSIEDAIFQASKINPEKICIIGGEQIYNSTINLADEIHYTEVNLDVSGTAKFPNIPNDFQKSIIGLYEDTIANPDQSSKNIQYEIQKWIKV